MRGTLMADACQLCGDPVYVVPIRGGAAVVSLDHASPNGGDWGVYFDGVSGEPYTAEIGRSGEGKRFERHVERCVGFHLPKVRRGWKRRRLK